MEKAKKEAHNGTRTPNVRMNEQWNSSQFVSTAIAQSSDTMIIQNIDFTNEGIINSNIEQKDFDGLYFDHLPLVHLKCVNFKICIPRLQIWNTWDVKIKTEFQMNKFLWWN